MYPLLAVACVLRLLTLAGAHPHLLDSVNPIGVQPSSLSLNRQYLPAIPADPTAAYLAGQRAGIAAPNIPLLIKLHNGQAGSTQAAELQFGKGHHAGYGHHSQVPLAPAAASSITHPLYSQGLHLPAKVQARPNLASMPSNDGMPSVETVESVEITTKPPSVLSAIAEKHTLDLPQPASLAPVLPSHPTYAAPAPTMQVPEAASMQEVPTIVTEDPEPTSALVAADPEPQGSTSETEATASTSNETKVSSNSLPYGFFRSDPFLMYRLPSSGTAQGEGHFVIMVPHRAASFASGHGKQKGVTVYLAKDVRVLKPHHHRELGFAY